VYAIYVWSIKTLQIWWSKQLSAALQSVALECDDRLKEWSHCATVFLFITQYSVLNFYENFHHLIATSSVANCFRVFLSSLLLTYFLSFCCCCCVNLNIKKVYIYFWQPDLICLLSAFSGSRLKCRSTIFQITPIIPFQLIQVESSCLLQRIL